MEINIMKVTKAVRREFLAELLGTFTLTCIGLSANAVAVTQAKANLGILYAGVSWGLALTVAIYVCGGVSGGHVNPAVTLGLACVGKFPYSKVLHYFIAQYIGAFLGAAVTYLVYIEMIHKELGPKLLTFGDKASAGIFGTFPNKESTNEVCFVDQLVATAFFLLIINAVTDKRNMNCPKGIVPILIGLCNLGLMVLSYGVISSAPLNPARDFAPRLFTSISGWGSEVFSFRNHTYFWIPIVACHLGGIIGSLIYYIFIELHWPSDDEST